jgi:hypothetical protein
VLHAATARLVKISTILSASFPPEIWLTYQPPQNTMDKNPHQTNHRPDTGK